MAAKSENCCSCCFNLIITMGLAALFLWLSLRADEPKCYLESIYVPALDKSLNNSPHSNSTLFFTLMLKNPNKDKGIKYDVVHLTFRIFNDSNATRPLANATLQGFYQGHQKKAHKPGNATVTAVDAVNTTVNGKVYFRVDFATKVKYKILVFYKKRHSVWGGANVEINGSGLKVYDKSIRLGNMPVRIESGAPKLRGRYHALVAFFVGVLVVLHAFT